MRAYDITQQYQILADIVDFDPETGEILDSATYAELLAQIDESRNTKLESIEYIKRNIDADSEMIAQEIKRLQGRKKANDTKVERLTNLQLMLLDGEKVTTSFFTFSTRKSESVKVPDVCDASYPKEWTNIKYTFDKKAIKEALKSGIDYSELGIELMQNISLNVK